ncbi:hypothetical protein NMY22_g12705 [Coprinellus aureogranulatus]|nr:hypothetical protein NMY22_g12705 [Coprinellus aureogranulatus]
MGAATFQSCLLARPTTERRARPKTMEYMLSIDEYLRRRRVVDDDDDDDEWAIEDDIAARRESRGNDLTAVRISRVARDWDGSGGKLGINFNVRFVCWPVPLFGKHQSRANKTRLGQRAFGVRKPIVNHGNAARSRISLLRPFVPAP